MAQDGWDRNMKSMKAARETSPWLHRDLAYISSCTGSAFRYNISGLRDAGHGAEKTDETRVYRKGKKREKEGKRCISVNHVVRSPLISFLLNRIKKVDLKESC